MVAYHLNWIKSDAIYPFQRRREHRIFRIWCLSMNIHCILHRSRSVHYNDVIMGEIASQITSLTIIYSIVYSDADQRKKSKLRVTGLCSGNSSETGEFPAQMASYVENVSIWWRHHGYMRASKKVSHSVVYYQVNATLQPVRHFSTTELQYIRFWSNTVHM